MSLKDVATKADVTFPTVSEVLEGKNVVSQKARIAIAGCDYIPLSEL